jgi:hypothetical protein
MISTRTRTLACWVAVQGDAWGQRGGLKRLEVVNPIDVPDYGSWLIAHHKLTMDAKMTAFDDAALGGAQKAPMANGTLRPHLDGDRFCERRAHVCTRPNPSSTIQNATCSDRNLPSTRNLTGDTIRRVFDHAFGAYQEG